MLYTHTLSPHARTAARERVSLSLSHLQGIFTREIVVGLQRIRPKKTITGEVQV
jgi:hypothetical protein